MPLSGEKDKERLLEKSDQCSFPNGIAEVSIFPLMIVNPIEVKSVTCRVTHVNPGGF
jgi:hypothetical protein